MADIFLSYSREDLDRVHPLVTELEKEGFTVWWDRELHPGENFEELIDREIQAARCVVVVWTENSLSSRWVRNEALEAQDRDILVPVLMDNVRVPVAFRRQHVANFTLWPNSVATHQYQRFIGAVTRTVRGDANAASPEPKGIAEMAAGYRPNFRRTRDYLTPVLIGVILVFGATLWLREPGTEQEAAPPPRLAIERFTGDGEIATFYADSLTRELEERFTGLDELDLVQSWDTFGLNLIFADASLLRESSDFLLAGSVTAEGGNLLVAARVENSGTGTPAWRGSFTGSEEDLLELQGKLIAAVLGVLKLESRRDLSSLMMRPLTTDQAAYRDYLKGKDLLARGEDHNIRGALSLFDAALERDPAFAMAHAALCRGYLELFRSAREVGDYHSGRDHCNQALELSEPRADIHLALAELYRVSGELDLARLEYLKTLELDNSNSDANMGLADIFVQSGNVQAGEELYQTATRLAPTYWKAHNMLGSFYFRQGMYYRAIESYLRVTELTNANATAFSNLGAARFYAGDFVGAYEAWERATELDTSSASFSNMGTALYLAGRFADAVAQYRTALRMDTSDHRLWGNVGDTLRFLPDKEEEAKAAYVEAIHLAEQNLSVNPNDSATISRLAVYYAASDRKDEAAEAMERAKILGGEDINVLYDLAVASALLGRDEATRQYRAAALGAGYPEVLLNSDPQFTHLNQVTRSAQ